MNINFSELEQFIARKYGCCDGVSIRPYNVVVTLNATGTVQKAPVEGINFDFVYWRVSTNGVGVKAQIEHNTGTYDSRDLYDVGADVGDRYPVVIQKTAKPNIQALAQSTGEESTFDVVLHGALIGG